MWRLLWTPTPPYPGPECSPTRSSLLSISSLPPPQISLPSGPIQVTSELRTLGLHISTLNLGSTISRLRRTSEQVSRMIRRVSSKRGGFRGRHSLRLAQAFVTSRVLYPTPNLRLPCHHENQLDSLLRSIHKRALDLPIPTSNRRFVVWQCITSMTSCGRPISSTKSTACPRQLLGTAFLISSH
ncbi:hypothetical protein HPB49_021315 [Dermacentor silvarum]|uniref:Uncharacterized protein n=1 Tax=Dermacentor silvarum TaxID=543639 RepID=A0ACB8D048_DERSI|nr:hypothetical protein HPB49_021315 [Dermacentor silvarum]